MNDPGRFRHWVRSRAFYELMQSYRHAPLMPPQRAVDAYTEVQDAILRAFDIIDGEFEEAAAPESPKRPELRDQRFQLNGDARLQFWREAYLNAQAALIRGAPYLPAMTSPRDVARAAVELADFALAMHLLRNDVSWPDTCVDLQQQWEKQLKGG